MSLTETLEIIDHKIHLDMTLPDSFTTKRVTVTISPEIEPKNEYIDPDRIKKLWGTLKLTDKEYQEIQEFLNEDR
jgi:hypothetical protein